MVTLQRQRVIWAGTIGGVGVGTHYFLDAAAHQTALRAFYQAIASTLPAGVGVTLEDAGDSVDSTTGDLVGSWVGTVTAPVSGSGTGGHPGGAGYQIRWGTDTILSSHRLRGRTFIVPASIDCFWSTGGLTALVASNVPGFGATLLAAVAGNMQIWQRPRLATPAWTDKFGKTHPALTARGGGYGPVTSCSTPDKTALLSSRRD